MFARSLAIVGASAFFAAAHSADADAFGRHHHGGKYKTCYKRVSTPPVYKTVTRQVMVRPATCSQYRTPPTYGTVAHEVMLQPSYQVVHQTPAVYGRVQVTKMVRPARTRWKRSCCGGCGEYRCAVTTPAKYRTRTKRVMVQPSQHWVETKPAVKGVVHKQVMLDAGKLKQVCQPAQYETVTEQVMVSPGTSHWVPVAHTGHAYTYHSTPVRYHQPAQYHPGHAPHYQRHYTPMK